MNENAQTRRVDDKSPDNPVDWSDAPRLTVLGVAETWAVTVEAEGQTVLCIGSDHLADLDDEHLQPFIPTIQSCAQHLLAFIGAGPVSSTVGAAKGGITSLEGLTRYDIGDCYTIGDSSEMEVATDGNYFKVADVEHLLATTAVEQAEPFDLHNAIMNIPPKRGDHEFMNAEHRMLYKNGHRDARHAAAELANEFAASKVAPAAPEQVQANEAKLAVGVHVNEHAATVAVSLHQGDQTTFLYCQDHRINCESMGTVSLPAGLFAAPSATQVQAIPASYKLVPIEPTSEMLDAALGGAIIQHNMRELARRGLIRNYAAMLAAAPIAAAPAAPEQDDLEFTAELDQLLARWARAAESGVFSHEEIRDKIVRHVRAYPAAEQVQTDAARNQALEDAARHVEDYQADKGIVSFNDIAHDIRAMKTATNEGEA